MQARHGNAIVVSLGLLGVVLAIGWLAGRVTPGVGGGERAAAVESTVLQPALGNVVQQGYPPPAPTPTATPAPDGAGYLPPPMGITSTIETITGSMHSAILQPMQAALDVDDASWFRNKVADGGLLLSAHGYEARGGGTVIGAVGVEDLLDQYFIGGSSPLVQGYFERVAQDGHMCLAVLVHAFVGGATHPPSLYPTTVPGSGPPPPATIEADSALWWWCRSYDGVWSLEEWHGGYYYTMAGLYAATYDGSTYHVIRP